MLQNGASAVITQKDLGLENQVIVSDTRKIFFLSMCKFFKNPAEKLKLIGLTGTNGKTTTTFLIKQILEQTGKKKVGLIELLGYDW